MQKWVLQKKGDNYIINDLCPPLCHELWNCMYPLVYALKNGASLNYREIRSKQFDVRRLLATNTQKGAGWYFYK